jgi:hypothetical protein
VRHRDVVAGSSYIGRGNDRTTRKVLAVGDADAAGVPVEHQKFLKLAQRFVRYQTVDGTVSWDSLTSFAQWATSFDDGWPRTNAAFVVDIHSAGIVVRVAAPLSSDDAEMLARWLRDAVRDKRHRDATPDGDDVADVDEESL